MELGQLIKFPPARVYILESDFDETLSEMTGKFDLPLARAQELLQLVYAVLREEITIPDMPALLEQAFGVDEAKARVIAAEIVGVILLPLNAYLPDIEQQLIALGGKSADYPAKRIPLARADQAVALKGITEKLGLDFSDVLLKRLHFFLEQYVKGEKTEEVLKTFFTRPLTIGGLGLTDVQSAALLAVALPQAGSFVTMPKPLETPAVVAPLPSVAVEETSVRAAIPAVKTVVVPVKTQELVVMPEHGLAAEVPVVNTHADTAPVPARVTARPVASEIKVPIADAKRAMEVREDRGGQLREAFEEAELVTLEALIPLIEHRKASEVKVFADLAGKAIRGIRDLIKTREMLEREFAFKPEDAAAFIEAIKLGIEAYHAAGATGKADEITEETAVAIEEAEAMVLNKRFSALTDTVSHERVLPILPGARVSAARSTAEEISGHGQVLGAEKMMKAEAASKPGPVKTELTEGSVAPKRDASRRMTDVVTAPRLVGPVEQLKTMTPVEFRRLSTSPGEAAQKIEDILSSLETVSYEERVRGIKAWRESPMNQLYISMTEEALSQGLAIPEVSSKRRAAGKDSLSPAETKVLVQLNARLRF